MSGIFARSFFDIGVFGIGAILVVAAVFFILWRRQVFLKKIVGFLSSFFLSGLVLFFFALGILRLEIIDRYVSPLESYVSDSVMLKGVVIREPDVRERVTHLYTKISDTDDIVLVIVDRYNLFTYGDEILIEGVLTLPESFETDLGRSFDYPKYLKARDVTYTVPFAVVTKIDSDQGKTFIAGLLRGKKNFTNVIERVVPEPQVGLGEGVLLGMKRALGDDLEEAFRRTGIIHIVVLSGYNVMIVAEAIMRLLSYVFTPRIRIVIGMAAITAFMFLVGLSATVVRASIMACFVLVARATGRIYAILRGLMIAGIIMLLINPYLLAFDPGFQLSFLATLGLIFLAPVIEKRFKLVPTKFKIREFLTATIATQIFVSPLLLYLMGSISIIAVLVNVLVLPAVPFAMLFTFITGVAGLFSMLLATMFGFVMHFFLTYIIVIAEFFSRFAYAVVDVEIFPFWVVVLLYIGIAFSIYRVTRIKDKTESVFAELGTDLSEWTIVEDVTEKEKPDEGHNSSSGSFPFR